MQSSLGKRPIGISFALVVATVFRRVRNERMTSSGSGRPIAVVSAVPAAPDGPFAMAASDSFAFAISTSSDIGLQFGYRHQEVVLRFRTGRDLSFLCHRYFLQRHVPSRADSRPRSVFQRDHLEGIVRLDVVGSLSRFGSFGFSRSISW